MSGEERHDEGVDEAIDIRDNGSICRMGLRSKNGWVTFSGERHDVWGGWCYKWNIFTPSDHYSSLIRIFFIAGALSPCISGHHPRYSFSLLPNPLSLIPAVLAERVGFEPTVPFWGTHALQACRLNRSRTSPPKYSFEVHPAAPLTDRLNRSRPSPRHYRDKGAGIREKISLVSGCGKIFAAERDTPLPECPRQPQLCG